MPPYRDRLPGGRADDRAPEDFDPEAVLKGIRVEREHTDDPRLATEITLDHLAEDPAYYDKLELVDRHDGGEGEADVHAPQIRIADPSSRTFVIGDEFCAEVGAIAGELYGRGAGLLGDATFDWLQGVVDAARSERS